MIVILYKFFAASRAPPPAPAQGGGGSMLGGIGSTIAQGNVNMFQQVNEEPRVI